MTNLLEVLRMSIDYAKGKFFFEACGDGGIHPLIP